MGLGLGLGLDWHEGDLACGRYCELRRCRLARPQRLRA